MRTAGLRQHQQGLSLISLMVGMVIAMMAVLGALALYRSTTQTVFGDGGLVRSSVQDGQLASGLLSAQIALQGAGYGLASPSSGSHFLLISNALLNPDAMTLSGTVTALTGAAQNGNALVWISNPNQSSNSADYRCAALVSDPSSRALYLLQSSGACNPLLTQWNKITWLRRTLIESNVMAQAVSLSAQKDSGCWPFGAVPQTISKISAPSASVTVRLAYGSSVTGSSNTYTSCLANLSS